MWGELSFKFPTLSLAVLAAVTPPDWQLEFIDDNFEKLDYANNADVIALTAMTAQVSRAYEIADAFRARGKTVVMGGFHVSNMPDEALLHADAVVVGEGEQVWPALLDDWRHGRLQRLYRSESLLATERIPAAGRQIFGKKGYLLTNTIQTTRGCPHDCEFCSVTAFYGRKYRKRPVDHVLAELREMRQANSFVFFVDDNIVADRRYATELFTGMREMEFKWLSHAPIDFAKDRELVKLAGASGCLGMFVGFESLNQDRLDAMGKTTNSAGAYLEHAAVFRDHGIGILGSFVMGCDGDTPDVFERTLRFCEDARLEAAIFPILTPYPGTTVRKRLEEEGRIISNDWRDYDMEHVTYKPKGMTVAQLQEGYNRICQEFYSFSSMYRRIFRLHRSLQVFAPMNFGFRAAIRRKGVAP